MGGPVVKYYPDLDPECAYVDDTVWRHNSCSIVITTGICKKCFSLHETLKKNKASQDVPKQRIRLKLSHNKQKKVNSMRNKMGGMKKILRKKDKKIIALEAELNETHKKFAAISQESVEEKMKAIMPNMSEYMVRS